MDKKEKLKHVELPDHVTFWKWATLDKLAVVTASSAYYLDLTTGEDKFSKVLDKSGALADSGST